MLPVPASGQTPTLDGIERTLATLIRDLPLDPRTRGRPEVLPTAMLWAGILCCILRGIPTQRAVWRAVTGAGLWSHAPVAITPEGVRKRIAGLGAGDDPDGLRSTDQPPDRPLERGHPARPARQRRRLRD
ncbi:MAG TPA: hypothetical protein VD767_09430 [Thermomicrobiales bacterium]|nr:hypothetical protein [Thermomicrobiales bacterium]